MGYLRRGITSFLLVFAIIIGLFGLGSSTHAAGASIFITPSSSNKTVGENFSMSVRVNTGGDTINAAEGSIVFDTSKLQVTSVSKSGSIFTLWATEPTFSNSDGTVNFGGGVPNPGYTGSGGLVLLINFKAKAATTVRGFTEVSPVSGAILANDGQGTNILSSFGRANIFIGASSVPSQTSTPTPTGDTPIITSSTHPDPTKWYNNKDPQFSWQLPDAVNAVSYLITDKPDSNPGNGSDGLKDKISFSGNADGVSYFHLKFRTNGTWGPIAHFKFQIDTVAPQNVSAQRVDTQANSRQPVITYSATDSLSGIDHYEIKIDGGAWSQLPADSQQYQLAQQSSGQHIIEVRALDKAGNSSSTNLIVNIGSLSLIQRILAFIKRLFGSLFYGSNQWFLLSLAVYVALISLLVHYLPDMIKRSYRGLAVLLAGLRRHSARTNSQDVSSKMNALVKDMERELSVLEKVQTHRTLYPEERYLKTKLNRYLKVLKKK